jgi:hypothetical protein
VIPSFAKPPGSAVFKSFKLFTSFFFHAAVGPQLSCRGAQPAREKGS